MFHLSPGERAGERASVYLISLMMQLRKAPVAGSLAAYFAVGS